jgi:hypothetical protein
MKEAMNELYTSILIEISIKYLIAAAVGLFFGIKLLFGIGKDGKITFRKGTSEWVQKAIRYSIKPMAIVMIVGSIYLSYSYLADCITKNIRDEIFQVSYIQINNRNLTDFVSVNDADGLNAPHRFRPDIKAGGRYKFKYFSQTRLVVEVTPWEVRK